MSWTLCSSAAVYGKAGEGVNQTAAASGGLMDKWSTQAEGRIIAETRRNWVSDYATVPIGVQGILDDVASSLIAIQLISYDMGGYSKIAEAQTMLNVQRDVAVQGLNILKSFDSSTIKPVVI